MRGPGLLVLLAAIGSGCSGQLSTEDAVGEDGKADQVDPHGHDNDSYLFVTSPASTRGTIAPSLTYRGVAMPADTKTRFTKGTGCLGLYNSLMTDCAVVINANQTTTYPLASLHLSWDPTAFQVDFGPEWVVSATRSGTRLMSAIATALFTNDVLTLPGDFHIEIIDLAVFAPRDVSLAGGDAKDIDLTAEKRATIHLIPPTRSFGSSSCSRGSLLVQRTNNGGILRSSMIPTQGDASYRVFPLTAADSSHYEVATGDLAAPITLAVGQTLDFKVKRIDVNNVLLTRNDGSTYYTKGTYVISRKDPATGAYQPAFGGCSAATPSGIDVVPGVYKIATSWATADGPDSEEDILDLR